MGHRCQACNFSWLVKQNCELGVAPKSAQIFEEVLRLINAQFALLLPAAVKEKLSSYYTEDNRAARYWLVSFRNRWGIDAGKLAVGEEMEPQDLQSREPWRPFCYVANQWFSFLLFVGVVVVGPAASSSNSAHPIQMIFFCQAHFSAAVQAPNSWVKMWPHFWGCLINLSLRVVPFCGPDFGTSFGPLKLEKLASKAGW